MTLVLDEIEGLEGQLKDAMIRGDVAALNDLLADDMISISQNGNIFTKADDLELHRSRQQVLTRFVTTEVRIKNYASASIVTSKVDLEGTFAGQPFAGIYRYTRVWLQRDGRWQVTSVHSSPSK